LQALRFLLEWFSEQERADVQSIFPLQDTVKRIKERVEEKEGIPPPQQRLIFGGKQMHDDKTASDYNCQYPMEPCQIFTIPIFKMSFPDWSSYACLYPIDGSLSFLHPIPLSFLVKKQVFVPLYGREHTQPEPHGVMTVFSIQLICKTFLAIFSLFNGAI
jgi:hypothetical protein